MVTRVKTIRAHLRRLLLHPVVLGFGSLGASLLGMASLWSGIWGGSLFGSTGMLGAGCLAIAGAHIFYRVGPGREKLKAQVQSDIRLRQQRKHLGYLRQLRSRLRKDGDTRTTELVVKMRKIYERMEDADTDGRPIRPETRDQARALYHSCLSLLENSLHRWRGANQMATADSRNELLRERDAIIGEVSKSIDHLDQTLDRLYLEKLQRKQSISDSNAQLRAELDEGLETARRVEARMEEFEREVGLNEDERQSD